MRRLLPEWHPQWGVLLAWPDEATDWRDQIEAAQDCYITLVSAILDHECVLLLVRDATQKALVEERLAAVGAPNHRLHCIEADYDDTWARDFGPISIHQDGALHLLDCRFTGWGGKFPADRDNALNKALPWQAPLENIDLVLEGGAIDTDGQGTLLTTRRCLCNPNRNPALDTATLERRLKKELGITRVWWLEHGHLDGDDTDAHVDTLVRFVNATTLAHVHCDDPQDSHYPELAAMERELQTLAAEQDLELLPLPMAEPRYGSAGERLPATYANFLITNRAILVPTYGSTRDPDALAALTTVAGSRQVIGIPCQALIEQYGSLHCVTMQLPAGSLGNEDTFGKEHAPRKSDTERHLSDTGTEV